MTKNVVLQPALGYRPEGKQGGRLLFICWYDPHGISTISENIACWQLFSRHSLEIINLWPSRGGSLQLPETLDIGEFKGIIIHCTASYLLEHLRHLDSGLPRRFRDYDGLKILMKQDEQITTSGFAEFIVEAKFDLVLTCVPPSQIDKVYPRSTVGDVAFLHIYTGYVSPFMREIAAPKISSRSLNLSYRGSIQPLEFGQLGFEKRKIGYDVVPAAAAHKLRYDISSRWQDRVNGPAWFDFLAASKAVLGVESGSNLFDFTGEVAAWCRNFEASRSESDPLSESFYREAHELHLHKFEGNVNYAQISPRHLEAAATRSAQVLYEGYYSGVFVPHRHFLPLKKDLSNFPEIVEAIHDDKRLSEMAECAFEEIVLNPQYHYESFVRQFDEAVTSALRDKGQAPRPLRSTGRSRPRPRALVLMGHEPTQDPRIDWMASGLADQFDVCELGTYRHGVDGVKPAWERITERRTRVRVERSRHEWCWLDTSRAEASAGAGSLAQLYVLAELPSRALARVVGALDANEADLARFRWWCRYFVNTNSALVQAARLLGTFDVIVAASLETLPAAIELGEASNAVTVYDAHEFWPFADLNFRHWEATFWAGLDRGLAARTDFRVTVSPQLAQLMSTEYACRFVAVPNAGPRAAAADVDVEAALRLQEQRNTVIFLFQGNFAPGRGLEELIGAWDKTVDSAHLWLRGPDSEFKSQMVELAGSRGLLDSRIYFPPAVPEGDVVLAARQADIGIVPYSRVNVNYRFSSPNMLSEYMAAGLPVLCNELDFVNEVVGRYDIGVSVDFSDPAALAEQINVMAASPRRISEMSHRARDAFLSEFNWEVVSRELYDGLQDATEARPLGDLQRQELDFSWIDRGSEMRRLPSELGTARTMFPDALEEIQGLNKEIAFLNRQFASETSRLKQEVAFLNAEFASETSRLKQEVASMNAEFAGETSRFKQEVGSLNAEFERETNRLIGERDRFRDDLTSPRIFLVLARGAARTIRCRWGAWLGRWRGSGISGRPNKPSDCHAELSAERSGPYLSDSKSKSLPK
jgi:glycosyltransferase involved in cell wall biosynthesis